jgi:predicted branched-subunit amino acid permease
MPSTTITGPIPTRELGSGAAADLLAVLPSIAPFGIALGMTAASLHAGSAATVLGAGLIYAGSAQLTVMTMLSSGAGLLAVIAAGILVNSRLLLYGAALEPQFRQQRMWFRLLAAHFIIEATYIGAISRPELDNPIAFRRYWLRMGFGLLVMWTAAVWLGVLLGPALPHLSHLGLVGFALFTAMVVPRLTDRPALVAAAAAGTAALGTWAIVPSLAVPVGAVAGVTAGTLVERRSS